MNFMNLNFILIFSKRRIMGRSSIDELIIIFPKILDITNHSEMTFNFTPSMN